MRGSVSFPGSRRLQAASFALVLCAAACFALTFHATTAHALFTSDVRLHTAHTIEAFPMELQVGADGYKARTKDIDRGQLTVTATFSDGTVRTLGADEYELSTATIPDGFKGDFETSVIYSERKHQVALPFTVNVSEAYAAQYGDTLVFGRGIPADTYESKTLTNTTWGIEEGSFTKKWTTAITSVVDIDTVSPRSTASWFNGYANLRSVALDQMDMSRVTSMAYMFNGATALSSITGMRNWNTGNVTTLEGTFRDVKSISTVDISTWNVSKVTNMHDMFCRCYNLTTLDLSSWNTASLQSVACMFYMCNGTSKLTSIGSLASWNLSKLTDMCNWFDHCRALKSIGDVSGWNTSKVTNMDCVFAQCEVMSVDCSNWSTASSPTHFDFRRNAPGVRAPYTNWT